MSLRPRGSSVARVALAVAAVVAVAAPGASAAGKPEGKAKLVIGGARFESSPAPSNSPRYPTVVLESDGRGKFGVEFKLRNVGDARSHNAHPTVFIGGKKYAGELVGPIDPGKSTTVEEKYTAKFKSPGEYEAYVCPSAKDCGKRAKHLTFSALPQRWSVDKFTAGSTLTGGAPFFAARSEGMTFDFAGTVKEPDDEYHLWLASGVVSGDVSGDDGTCNYTGQGAVAHSPWDALPPAKGYLLIRTDLRGYYAEVTDDDHAFISTQTCPGIGYSNDETIGILTLQTTSAGDSDDQPMDPTAKTLAGDYNLPTGFGTGAGTGSWSFRADLP